MTVESQVNKTEAMVMGSSATYDFSFHVLLNDPTENEAKQAIKVSISDGETTTQLEYGTDYTVSLNDDGNGGTVTVADMKTSDYSLIIYREYDFKQGSDYQNYNSFPADTLEGNLDKNVMVAQQLNEKLDRAVLLDMFSTSSPNEYAAKIEALYDIRNEIVTDAQISAAITDVSGNETNINAVAANETNINAVAANETNINAVKANETNINTTATNINAVNSAAENMTAIQNAPTQASNAAASATLAEKWASQMDDPVSGSDYSAKKYAMDAQEAAVQAGYSVDPLFTERDFTDDAPPSYLSWVRTDQMDTMFDGNLYEAAFNALKDGEPIATQHNGIKQLNNSSLTIQDGSIYSGITVAAGLNTTKGYIEIPNFSSASLTTVNAALDNDDFSYFVVSKAFGLQVASYSSMTADTWYNLWDDGFLGLDMKYSGGNLVFRPKVYQNGVGWVIGNEATKTPVAYFFNCQVTLRADSNTSAFRIIFYNSNENVSSTKDTTLTNAQVKAGLAITNSIYSVRAITYCCVPNTTVAYSINAHNAQLLQCFSNTPFAYSVQEFQSYNSQWTSYDFTGTDTYTIGGTTYTINYKTYNGKKFIRNDQTYLAAKNILSAFGKQPYYCVDNANKKFMLPCQQADHGVVTIHSNLTGTSSGEIAMLNIYEDGYFEVVGKVSAGKSLTFRQDVGDIYSLMASAGTISYSSKTLTLSAACSFYVTGGIGDNGKLKRTKHHYSLVGMHQDGMDIDVEYIEGKIEEKVSQMSASVPEFLGQYMFSEVNPHKACWLVSDGEYKLKQAYPDMWNQLQTELDDTIEESDVKTIDGKQYIKRGLPVVTTSDTITDEDFVVNAVAGTFRVPVKPRGCIVSRNYNNWYLLFYVGNTVENIEKIAADVIAGSLPTKANRNLSNLTETGNTTLIHKNSVSKRSINFISGSTTKNDGFIYYGGVAAASGGPHKFKVLVVDPDDSDAVIFQKTCQVGDGDDFGIMTPVGVGCKVTASYNNPPASSSLKFIFPNGISSDHVFNPLLFWDQQQYGDLSRDDLKAWSIVPYDHSNDEFLAYTTTAVPQVGDTVWLLKSNSFWTENPTVTRTATILALGEGYGSKRAIYVSGCTSGVYYERHPWYDRNGSFSS